MGRRHLAWFGLCLAGCGEVRAHSGGGTSSPPDGAARVHALNHDGGTTLAVGHDGGVAQATQGVDGSLAADARVHHGSSWDASEAPGCIPPCLFEQMLRCSAPHMSTCYRDGDGGRAALCDPATGWSLTPYEGGQYGSGWILARDGVPCLRSRGGGEGVGLVYYDGTGAPVVWNFGMTTSTGLQVVTRCMPSGPEFTTTNPADCADLFTLPMTFDCDRVVPGSCPSVAW